VKCSYYPVSEHLRLLDPEVVLVVGSSGSGKTEIVRVLSDPKLAKAVARYAPHNVHLPSGASEWVIAFPVDSVVFDATELKAYVQREKSEIDSMRELWFAHLIRFLADRYEAVDKDKLQVVTALPSTDIGGIMREFHQLGTAPVVAMDRLDGRLEQEGRYLFLIYDGLDDLDGESIRGLVAFWAVYTRRWKRIRAKVFLRTDLFDRYATAGGADLAKLIAGRVELVWSERDLFGRLLQRLVNSKEIKGVSWVEDEDFGFVPQIHDLQAARSDIKRILKCVNR